MNEKKRVLLSGATGFFGSIASAYFEQNGFEVITAGRKSDQVDIYFDLNDPEAFSKKIIDISVDLFIHAAAANEIACRNNPYESIFQNVIGTRASLDFCINNKIDKYVYLSTFHVFGKPNGFINEDSNPIPDNDYGLSHFQAEQYVSLYARQRKIKTLIVRPTNFIDTPSNLLSFKRWTLAPYEFCRDAVLKRKIVLNTAGYQKRNFLSVTELCHVIRLVYDKGFNYNLLHVYGHDTLTIFELAMKVRDVIKEEYNFDVSLFIPEGVNDELLYEYCSKYLDEIYTPNKRVSDFIIEMVCKLAKDND